MPLTANDRARLRRAIGEPDESNGYTDVLLDSIYDENVQDFNATAADVWRDKAAKAAHLVDVTEGPSSRKMSQLQDQALDMVKLYSAGASSAPVTTRSATTRAIERV